jgi:hypothetical protein
LQLPEAGHWPEFVHDWLVLLQDPLTMSHSLATVQTFLRMLHVPTFTQSDCCEHELPMRLHAPGRVGHWPGALLVQLAWLTLHLPGSGVHDGGVHVVTGVH